MEKAFYENGIINQDDDDVLVEGDPVETDPMAPVRDEPVVPGGDESLEGEESK